MVQSKTLERMENFSKVNINQYFNKKIKILPVISKDPRNKRIRSH